VIDLHAHVLPGVDDGPADLDGALAMLEAAARDGTRLIAATPHLRSDHPDVRVGEIAGAVRELQAAVPAEWNLRIVAGGEVDLAWAARASEQDLRLACFGERGRDVLIETPHGSLPAGFEDALFRLTLKGLRVTLAHPELNATFQRRPDRLTALVQRGVLLQVTSAALLADAHRAKHAQLARNLVRDGLAHLIASDAHSATWRPPGLSAAVAIAREIAPRRAGWMVTVAPAAVIAGRALPPLPPEGAPVAPRSSWRARR